MTYKIRLLETSLFAVFQHALPMKSFTTKYSSSKKSFSEILAYENLQIDVLKFF